MGQTAYKGKVYVAGAWIDFTDARVQGAGANTFTSINPVHRLLARERPVVLENNGVPLPTDDIVHIDYLNGTIETAAAYQINNLRLSGSYVPIQHVANVKSFSINCSTTMLDTTYIDGEMTAGNGWMKRTEGLQDVSVDLSLTRLDDAAFPARAAAPNLTNNLRTALKDRNPVLLYLQTKETTPYGLIKGWFVLESNNQEGGVDDLEMQSITMQLDGELGASFSWESIT